MGKDSRSSSNFANSSSFIARLETVSRRNHYGDCHRGNSSCTHVKRKTNNNMGTTTSACRSYRYPVLTAIWVRSFVVAQCLNKTFRPAPETKPTAIVSGVQRILPDPPNRLLPTDTSRRAELDLPNLLPDLPNRSTKLPLLPTRYCSPSPPTPPTVDRLALRFPLPAAGEDPRRS